MLFNSLEFLIFFVIITVLYYAGKQPFRLFILFIASCFFYMFFVPEYILILFLLILIDFFAAKFIYENPRHKKLLLILSLSANIGVLCFFKYFNFFNSNLSGLVSLIGWNYPVSYLDILLPIGLSFHTFQSLSYVMEVYKGDYKPEKNILIYGLYVMYYPQLVAGPIERPQNLLPQLKIEHKFDYHNVTNGLKLMLWGFFKKVVIADRLAGIVNEVFNTPHEYTGLHLIIASVMFAIQIYCDFSGYSDIAIGSSLVMGIKLMKNFDRPYFAANIQDYWRRWHISLSSWFRDYVYIPLGGSRVVKWRFSYNLLFVFMLSGLWHGANWTFVIWGALNGFYVIMSRLTEKIRSKINDFTGLSRLKRIHKIIQIAITFSMVCFAFIFFRANSVNDAFYIITHLFSGIGAQIQQLANIPGVYQKLGYLFIYGYSKASPGLVIVSLLILFSVENFQGRLNVYEWLNKKPLLVRFSAYLFFIFFILLFGVFNNPKSFIYFQF